MDIGFCPDPWNDIGGHLPRRPQLQTGIQEGAEGLFVNISVGEIQIDEIDPRHSKIPHIPLNLPHIIRDVVARFGLSPPAEAAARTQRGMLGITGVGLRHVVVGGKTDLAVRPDQVEQTDVLVLFRQSRLFVCHQLTAKCIGSGLVVIRNQDLGRCSLFRQNLFCRRGRVECRDILTTALSRLFHV